MPENGGSIVLIEDDTSQRRIMQHSLEQAGYKLHLVDNARDGLIHVRSVDPKLVITDICLGESNGIELLSEIKSYRSFGVPE